MNVSAKAGVRHPAAQSGAVGLVKLPLLGLRREACVQGAQGQLLIAGAGLEDPHARGPRHRTVEKGFPEARVKPACAASEARQKRGGCVYSSHEHIPKLNNSITILESTKGYNTSYC